jgi:hypothetical protein
MLHRIVLVLVRILSLQNNADQVRLEFLCRR